MKTVIVYYSLTGNTAWAAARLARELDADMLELKPRKAYPDRGFRMFFRGGKSAISGEQPALEPYDFDAGAFDCVILVTPLWAGRISPPLRSFLASHGGELAGKRLGAVICCSGGKDKKAFEQIRTLAGNEPAARLRLVNPKDRPDPANEVRMAHFADSLRDKEALS